MKSLFFGTLLLTASSYALSAHGPAGCGLGTEVVFKNPTQWHEHVLAATTNATSGNQTFGMTSGTLGCESANGPLAGVQLFIDNNMDQLAMDVANGQGESLDALAEVIGVSVQDRPAFNETMQANFDKLFSGEGRSSDTYSAVVYAMESNDLLKKYLV